MGEYPFQGNVCSKAIGVGDVDNDECNELTIGNIHGDLHVHKGPGSDPWRKATGLGTITCVQVGDVCNHGINYIIVASLEGWVFIYSVTSDSERQDGKKEESNQDLKAAYKQHLVANSRSMIIADIDGDGLNELVIGYSDRTVRSFRWKEEGREAS